MYNRKVGRAALKTSVAAAALLAFTAPEFAHAQAVQYSFDIPAQDVSSALIAYGRAARQQLVFDGTALKNRQSSSLVGEYSAEGGLSRLLEGTGLHAEYSGSGAIRIVSASDPQSGSAAGDGADNGTVQALIVTAQKREEDIQDVPIAISAFTQEDLTRSQVAGGPDLITQVPNMTFTKTNFSSYSIQLRGIGTQAISATTDPAVAVAFNNTPFIRNRFFEQEFYDLQRVEVLRGPQGTLYGRNATAGVVNIISAKPKFHYEAKLSLDLGNYSSYRLEGMVNLPLVEDKVALRVAGAWTKRDGYSSNELTGKQIDGRDLWSTRVTLRVTPTDRLDANLIWEHFQEDDDRLRSGKQLCTRDVVEQVGGIPVTYFQTFPGGQSLLFSGVQATLSQGCKRGSLYDPTAFQKPNGLMLPYYNPLGVIGLPIANQPVLPDPYTDPNQSHDLRAIESQIEPEYRANNDLGELQVSFDLTNALTLSSETAYARDEVFSLQDFNRFNSAEGVWRQPRSNDRVGTVLPGPIIGTNNGGIICDPQLGCSNRLIAVDISTAKASQFSEELRLSSDFAGPFNFSLGANYLRGDSEDKYYVFINSLSAIAENPWLVFPNSQINPYVNGVTDNSQCMANGYAAGDPNYFYSVAGCTYIDPNPVSSLNDEGHNYFLSKNPYKLISYAVFGEAYYNITKALKVTAGLRWTIDKKDAPRVPTWLLNSESVGYPVAEVIQQEWREPTGRIAVDWKPVFAFTDQTLVYGSYAHGYKAGGANPPGFVRAFYSNPDVAYLNSQASATRPRTFNPEFVDAFEVGTKNTLLGGRATVNLAAFYYDYKDYQISEIVDRSAFNRNFDADVWGVELESDWRPVENLKLGLKIGYEKTRIADGEKAVDLMDRTAGMPGWQVVRPFPTYASSCILPTYLFVQDGAVDNVGNVGGGSLGGCELAYLLHVDPITGNTYTANPPGPYYNNGGASAYYPGYIGFDPASAPNNGEGFYKDLSGNQLPNAPQWTATTTGDYTLPLANDWLMTLHTDVHWQSQSWWRVFNDNAYDKLHPYFTMNLAAIFTNEDAGWNIMAYVKNVTDETAITGAFLNSDDTGLTTNVFLTEPRLYGLRVTKSWTGEPLFGSLARHEGPYPLTVALEGQVQRYDSSATTLNPSFANQFQGPVAVFDQHQASDLDWGNGGAVEVTWRPNGGPWFVTGGYRTGETGTYTKANTDVPSDPVCAFAGPQISLCEALAGDPLYGYLTRYTQADYLHSRIFDREEQHVVELAVGHEVPVGILKQSNVGFGLQRVRLESLTEATYLGTPDWVIPEGFGSLGLPVTHTLYRSVMSAHREFTGAGPVINWDASLPILDLGDRGAVSVEWRVEGALLFGNRKTNIQGQDAKDLYSIDVYELLGYLAKPGKPNSSVTLPPLSISRNEDATVPTGSVSLGLSYSVGAFKASAGYRLEKYFDAIDDGLGTAQDGDRTIDGPYFKIAVGFGG